MDHPHSDVSHNHFYDISTFPTHVLPVVWHQSEDEQASFGLFSAFALVIKDGAS